MPHSQKLTELKEFKWALRGPLGAAVIVAIIITVADYLSPESLQFCLTSECFNDAIKRHKFSLGVAALVFPLVALVAAYHRSVQTAAQIERADSQIRLTDSKNNFENYIKHKEIFKRNLEKFTRNSSIKKINYEKLYKAIFVSNNAKYFDPYVTDENNLLTNLEKCIFDMVKSQEEVTYINYLIFVNSLLEFEGIFSDFVEKDKMHVRGFILDLEEVQRNLSLLLSLYSEISLLAYSGEKIFTFSEEGKKFINEVHYFEKLMIAEDGSGYGTDEWGQYRASFGDHFYHKIVQEYNSYELNLKNLDEYLNNREEF